jgi:hypothetical protein
MGYMACSERFYIKKIIFSIIFAGYSFSYTLDLYMVLSPADGAALAHGFWVQPSGNGCA